MRSTRSAGDRLAVASAVAGALLLMASCSGSSSPDSSESPVGPSSSAATSTPPASTTSPSPANTDAVASVRAYLAMVDKLRSNPKASLDQLSTVARGRAADNWRQILLNDRSAGHHQTGTTKPSVISATLGSSDQQWVVTMCLDVSDVNIVDRSGKSVVSKNRPDRVRDALTVDQDTGSAKWYVTEDKVTATC